jgi:hypothetical protein
MTITAPDGGREVTEVERNQLPRATLMQGRPGYTRLTTLERQLRSRKCGARGQASLEVALRPRD